MRPDAVLILVTGLFFLAASADASRPKKVRGRKIASIERSWDGGRVTEGLRRTEKDTTLRIGVSSGYASNSTNVANTQASRQKNEQTQSASFGLNARLNFLNYGYADLDGYYAGGLSFKTVNAFDRVSGTTETSAQRRQSYGALGEVGAWVPFRKGNVRWTPTVAAGFGYMTTRDQKQSLTDTESSERTAVGPYVSAGLGVELGSRFALSGDAAISVFAKGTVDSGGAPTILNGNDSVSAQFMRVRLGAYYQNSAPVTVGVQYFRRRLSTQTPGERISYTETTNQFLGSLQFNF